MPVALADPPYANCKEAHADGKYNIPRGAPGYSAKLDRDRDGLACEG
nr:excalibur calcium-binding domain-containing protein [Mycobacteroides abscessus]